MVQGSRDSTVEDEDNAGIRRIGGKFIVPSPSAATEEIVHAKTALDPGILHRSLQLGLCATHTSEDHANDHISGLACLGAFRERSHQGTIQISHCLAFPAAN